MVATIRLPSALFIEPELSTIQIRRGKDDALVARASAKPFV